MSRGGRMKLGKAPQLPDAVKAALYAWVRTTAYPLRNEVIVRLSTEAGLRATESGRVRWDNAFDRTWRLRSRLILPPSDTKGGYGAREIWMDPCGLGAALECLRDARRPDAQNGYVIAFRKHRDMFRKHRDALRVRAASVRGVFRAGFTAIGYPDATSHSGRRTAITLISRTVGLREAQAFAGHRNPATTLRYVDPDYDALERVVREQLVLCPRPRMAKATLPHATLRLLEKGVSRGA